MIIFSAPSGAGKTSIIKGILKSLPELEFSISATSRNKRQGEQQGVDYYFLSPEEFRQRIDNDQFLEWEEVYTDNFYGTLNSELQRIWAKGNHVIFDVDVAGGINIKQKYPEQSLSVFVMPPSLEELGRRLTQRGTETQESLDKRLGKAHQEISAAGKFDRIVINDDLHQATQSVIKIIREFLEKP